jgi:hypothetical protein
MQDALLQQQHPALQWVSHCRLLWLWLLGSNWNVFDFAAAWFGLLEFISWGLQQHNVDSYVLSKSVLCKCDQPCRCGLQCRSC